MGLSAKDVDFGSGFNDADFSDRVLRLEILPALASDKISSLDGENTLEFGAIDLKLKKIPTNSFVLASKSPFFYQLFKNGMRESRQKDEVALRIYESEEAALMDLLKFIYDYSVNATTAHEVVDVLMAAHKFEVPSCIRYCVYMLLNLPMSTELALLCLGLPSCVLADEEVQKLIEPAKKYICAHYKDFTKSRVLEEAMDLPLSAVEIVIGRDGLQVDSEDVVFYFLLKWGRLHYPELEKRRAILTKLLVNFICLPNMSNLKLKEVVDCSDIEYEQVTKPVLDALFSKDRRLAATTTRKYDYPRRVYIYVNEKHECADLFPSKRLCSQTLCLACNAGGPKGFQWRKVSIPPSFPSFTSLYAFANFTTSFKLSVPDLSEGEHEM
ncbi:hypothetical protein V2J09_021985 [Rumex salicifolius]